MLEVEVEGAEQFGLIVRAIQENVAPATQKAMYRLASRLAGLVRDVIIRQTQPDWPALSAKYARWKERMGFDPRMLRVTGQYVQSIVPRRVGDDYVVSASPEPHRDPVTGEEDPNVTMTKLSAWLEYGFDVIGKDGKRHRMPPRPHFRPVYRAFQEKVVAGTSETEEEIWRELQPLVEASLRHNSLSHHRR